MLYQLAMYSMSGVGNRRSVILYPTLDPKAREARIQLRDPIGAHEQGQVILRPVNLLQLESLVTRKNADRERRHFAQILVFGKP